MPKLSDQARPTEATRVETETTNTPTTPPTNSIDAPVAVPSMWLPHSNVYKMQIWFHHIHSIIGCAGCAKRRMQPAICSSKTKIKTNKANANKKPTPPGAMATPFWPSRRWRQKTFVFTDCGCTQSRCGVCDRAILLSYSYSYGALCVCLCPGKHRCGITSFYCTNHDCTRTTGNSVQSAMHIVCNASWSCVYMWARVPDRVRYAWALLLYIYNIYNNAHTHNAHRHLKFIAQYFHSPRQNGDDQQQHCDMRCARPHNALFLMRQNLMCTRVAQSIYV